MRDAADLILENGKVVTCDGAFRIARAVAVRGERILALGETDAVRRYADAQTRVIDLKGRTVVPGLIDGHAHMDREGLKDAYPSLAGARSIDDILQRIEALVREAEPGQWIVTMPIGDPPYYWDVPNNLRERRFPTRRELDRVAPDNPVYIRSIWGFWRHTLPLVSVANSRALAIAGVDRDTPSPCDAVEIVRDESGEPTGVFVERTFMPVVELTIMRAAGGFSHDQRVRGLPAAMRAYNAVGTTSVFEEHGVAGEVLRAYRDVRAQGRATIRTNLVFSPSWGAVAGAPVDLLMASWGSWLSGRGLGDDMLRVGGMYVEVAGAIGDPAENAARLAARPYTGWSGFNYDASLPRDRLKEVLIAAARNDVRVIGLWPQLLDLYAEVDRVVPIAGRRWVLGHINDLGDDEIKRVADLGILLTTHTNRYIFKEGHLTLDRLGRDKEDTIVPLRRLREAGVRFGLATDNVPVSLFHPIWHCVARRCRYLDRPVAPGQALSREEALLAATADAAHLTFEEDEKGTIEVGKLADLAVLSEDPLTCDEDALPEIVAETTIVGGHIVYQRGGTEQGKEDAAPNQTAKEG